MSQVRPPHTLLSLEHLESRENPSGGINETFDTVSAPLLPGGWAYWANDGSQQFITSRLQPASGPNALASLGARTTEARFWATAEQPGDSTVAASVRSDTPTPIDLLARGQNLNTATPSYLAATVRSGGTVELTQEVNGTRTVLGTVRPTAALPATWLRVTLVPAGDKATVRVQRADTGQYLTPTGGWQAAAVDAVSKTVTHRPATGLTGLGREAGGAGMTFADDFTATPPATVPPASSGNRESFDTTAAGTLPAGWKQWSSDATGRASVSAARSLSPANALTVDGSSVTRARAWLDAVQPADVSVGVSVSADSLIPAGVIVRGANLNTAAPTYYSLTLTRGVTVELKRVVDGAETTLGTLRSTAYVSGPWVRLTLVAAGDRLRAVVFRTDTQQWLAADGSWRGTPESALDLTDTAIRAAGLSGVERGRVAAGAVWVDDFETRPAAVGGPRVDVSADQPGTVYSDVVRFTATATPADVARVEFTLDGKLRAVRTGSPAVWDLDTLLLTDGPHTLTVRVVDWDGNAGTATYTFTADNNGGGKPDRPAGVRKYTHIRLAQLAYSGNPMGAYEQALAKNSLDLIVPNPQYLSKLEGVAADTPKVVYTNVSNLYGSLLTDWLAYADRTGADREAAFFHVAQATAFTGASPSSVPVNQFWGVYRGAAAGGGALTDLTGEARGTRPAGVGFGTAGQAVSVGWTDRFREINVVLNTPASGWAGRFEYVAEVNADGTPKTWKTLTLLTNGTAGFTKNGQITFDPPRDWKAAKLPGTAQSLYYVRVVTTAGTGANAKTLLGRDYVGASGRAQGTIPAFDAAADKDGDGYLNDAEYAGRRGGFDARFVHESRLFYPYYGQMRFVTNPGSVPLHRWAADYHVRLLAATPNADGFFVDNAHGKLPFAGTATVEPTDTFTDDMADVMASITRAVPGKWVVANTAGSIAEGDAIAAASTAAFEEFVLRPNDVNWTGLEDVAQLVKGRLSADSPSPYLILDSHPGAGSITTERTRMGVLAYYYLLADPDKTFLTFFGGYAPAAAWNTVFVPAATTDVGQPQGAMTVFATGADPANAALTYKVYARDYGNAKVLFKPKSYTLGKGTGTTADATATTHDLGGRYRQLYSDGSLGAAITRITLRNGEGVVLMKA
jgi:hypothetical protein